MAGKTVSAYADEQTARRVESMAKTEDRPVSQIASAALAFYVRLPAEAHTALRAIEAQGGEAAVEQVAREVTRHILDAEYEGARQQIVDRMQVEGIDRMETEEDILDAAVRMTQEGTPTRRTRAPRGRRSAG